jgi:alkanesulfonate monooxygenase SsuD/methylene tetrahydromethanopterin reductase-like flavin-dependent oxidoreductase (luciferase family)
MPHPVRIGLKVSCEDISAAAMVRSWKIADEAGFDHLWAFDHLAGVKGDPRHDIFEAWSLLAAMSQATTRVRLGCLVTGNTYRHPVLLAKLAVTVDHLSGGRLEFGLGAAHAPAEHLMYGIEGLDHRLGRLSESLQVLESLWTQDRTTFAGRYYRLQDAIANPKPLQVPRPPVWIGGRGPSTLRLVARHADVWNVTVRGDADAGEDARVAAALGRRLQELCGEEGRDPGAIRWSGQVFWDGRDRGRLSSDVAAYLDQGFTEIVIFPDVRGTGADPVAAAQAAGEELAALRALRPPVSGRPPGR